MSLLDRYVLRIFLNAFVTCLLAFLFLFVLIDFATQSTRFFDLEGYSVGAFFLEYYLIRIPVFAQYTLPSVTMVAAVYTFVHLARRNEILPIVASGRSLRRTATPLIVFAVCIGGTMALIDEFILPRLSEHLGQTYSVLRSHGDEEGNIQLYGTEGTLLEAGKYDYRSKTLHSLRFTEIRPTGRRNRFLVAKTGKWSVEENGWILQDGVIHLFDENGNHLLKKNEDGLLIQRQDPLPAVYHCEISEEDLHRRNKFFGTFVAIDDLRQRVRDFPEVPDIRIQLYSRFAFPWTPLVLLLVGLPTIPVTARNNFFRGLITSFSIALGFYASYFILQDLGGFGRIPPLFAAFGATGGFGILGLWLFFRERF